MDLGSTCGRPGWPEIGLNAVMTAAASTAASIEGRGLIKTFGSFTAVNGLTLNIRSGEFVSLIGPSGCGKSTFMLMAAGLIPTSSGELLVNGKPLRDPSDETRILGYEAFYLGTATQTRPGQPATFEITSATQEIGRGDRLVPAAKPAMVHYVPHKPDTPVDGRVVSIYGGVGSAGRGSIISLNLGNQDGLEIGHVLALERNRTVTQRDENDQKINVKVPAERTGLVFVFRTFDHISYALVVQSEGTVEVNDFVRTP